MTITLKDVLNKLLYVMFGGSNFESTSTDLKNVSNIDDNSSDVQVEGGAPVENESPLGYNNDLMTSVYLIIAGVVGTGIFSTPASVLSSIGSIGASYVLWVTCFLIALFQCFVYIEFVTYFKKRNGGDVAYLEQAFPKPKFMIPTMYAAVTVILSFSTSSAIAFGQYVLSAAGVEPTTWKQRGIGVGVLTFVALATAINSKIAMKLSNFIGFVKVIFLLFMAITSFVTLGGHTNVKEPLVNFHDAWKGTTSNGNAIANAIVKVTFSYGGVGYAFGVVGEHRDPIRTYKIYVPLTLFFLFILYIVIITGYFAGGGTIDEIKHSGNLVASAFFLNVFGSKNATKALDAFVAISAFGHLLAVVISHSRALRECGRQGVVPYPALWTSTKPFGTPLLPIIITWIVNVIVLLAPPAGSAYNFIVDLGSYSGNIFSLALVVGLLRVRNDRKKLGLGYNGFKVPMPILIITILFQVFVILVTWVPPANGSLIGSDVTFFYATYPITTIGLLLLCVLYYYVWSLVLPKVGGYVHREETYQLENGELGNQVVKVKLEDLQEWEENHKHVGVSAVISTGGLTSDEKDHLSTLKSRQLTNTEVRDIESISV